MTRNLFKTLGVAMVCVLSLPLSAQQKAGTVDLFMGAELKYQDIYYNNRVFDVLVNLTPAVRWRMANRWEAAVQGQIAVINQYGDYYKRPRISMATLSKQLAPTAWWKTRLSVGMFSGERYGVDMRNMFIANSWLAFTVDLGLTGRAAMYNGLYATSLHRFSFLAGPSVYHKATNTEVRLQGGRFYSGTMGLRCEGYRHFQHCSVGLYATYSETYKENMGFKVVMMIPPYKRPAVRRVNFHLANNFRFTNNITANRKDCEYYFVDPEQNERNGYFDADLLPWGQDTMQPDFTNAE